jgi:succinate dehydrogenase/fumarate reductase flavoprotein subunit
MNEIEVDIAVIGTGAAGLSAALTAAVEGASVCVLEKASLVGGTTAVSGGLTWIPNNEHMSEVGIDDSYEEAYGYIQRNTLGRGDDALIDLYVKEGRNVIAYLQEHASIDYGAVPHYPDYHPEFEGGRTGGRPVEGPIFDTHRLGEWAPKLRRSPIFGRSPMRVREATEWGAFSNPLGLPYKEIGRRAKAGYVCRGSALIGHLLKACLDRGVEPMLETPAEELITEGGRVVGVTATTADGPVRVLAAKGVILASGGFEWSQRLVQQFMHGVLTHPNSPPQCEGDGLTMAMSVGAQLGNMGEAWWAPSVIVPGERYDGAPLYRAEFAIRTLPHSIIVNGAGRRFVNEALNYNDLMKPFHDIDPNTMTRPNLPAWLIVDQQFLDRYLFVGTVPGREPPEFVTKAESLQALAHTIDVDADGLAATMSRFNEFARTGQDTDFSRGQSAYDKFYGDPNHSPNPCLGTLEKVPFYAVEVHPGALGTKGGPVTDLDGRVLHVNGAPIEGLYAAGNVAASLSGAGYPGPGITIGAALLWGHLAAKHAASKE